jgi:hypothetical protein
MTILEKCEILKRKGYTYDPETGNIYGMYRKLIQRKMTNGYIQINGRGHFGGHLLGHHFAWYMSYGNDDFIMLDHINRIKNDNRISNLRKVTCQENSYNKDCKGYFWSKHLNKFKAQLRVDKKYKYLGCFTNEEDARQAYLKGKEKYHIINN